MSQWNSKRSYTSDLTDIWRCQSYDCLYNVGLNVRGPFNNHRSLFFRILTHTQQYRTYTGNNGTESVHNIFVVLCTDLQGPKYIECTFWCSRMMMINASSNKNSDLFWVISTNNILFKCGNVILKWDRSMSGSISESLWRA